MPNLQVFALTKDVHRDTATWVGLENSLGDFVVILDPYTDEISMIPTMLDHCVSGSDVVFAKNSHKSENSIIYRLASKLFDAAFRRLHGIQFAQDAPLYRLMSRKVVNFLLRHQQPISSYRHLPATGGFKRVNLEFSRKAAITRKRRLWSSVDCGLQILVSTNSSPMRFVNAICLFAATANVVYSVYVVAVSLLKTNVAPGWTSLSLQQSGMFFLLSLVLLVLGEYILHMTQLANDAPKYNVGHEFTSARMTRQEQLNVEESGQRSTVKP